MDVSTLTIWSFVCLAAAPMLSAGMIETLRAPLVKLGLVDTPDHRKRHDGSIPLAGGPAMATAFALLLLISGAWYNQYTGLLAAMLVVCAMGIADDRYGLRASVKFALQIGVALLLIYFNDLTIDHLGAITGDARVHLGNWYAPFTILCVVGLINAINMMDGLDGLAGGVVAVMLAGLALVAIIGGAPEAALGPALLLGVLAGFLAYNFPGIRGERPRIFMGDSGSMMLGIAIAWFAIDITFQRGTGVPPMTIAWILALPVVDTVVIMTRRVLKGRSPMTPDRGHLHHILQRIGLSNTQTTWLAIALTAVTAVIGIAAWQLHIGQEWLFTGFLLLLAVNLLFINSAWRVARTIRRWRSASRSDDRGPPGAGTPQTDRPGE